MKTNKEIIREVKPKENEILEKYIQEKSKTLTIDIPSGQDAEYVTAEVLRLIKEGYTSGIDPTFDIV